MSTLFLFAHARKQNGGFAVKWLRGRGENTSGARRTATSRKE